MATGIDPSGTAPAAGRASPRSAATTGAAGRRGRGSSAGVAPRRAPRRGPARRTRGSGPRGPRGRSPAAGRPATRSRARAGAPRRSRRPAAAPTASTGMNVARTSSSRPSQRPHAAEQAPPVLEDGVPQRRRGGPARQPADALGHRPGRVPLVRVDELGHAPADGLLEGLAARDGLGEGRFALVQAGLAGELGRAGALGRLRRRAGGRRALGLRARRRGSGPLRAARDHPADAPPDTPDRVGPRLGAPEIGEQSPEPASPPRGHRPHPRRVARTTVSVTRSDPEG